VKGKILQDYCRILQDCWRKGKFMVDTLLLQPESKVLEFKRDLSSLEPILKTIVAFANTAGGTLLIGRTSDGSVVGVKDIFRAEEALANSIADNIRPALLPEIEITTIGDKDLLVVKVSHWKGPFYLKKEGMPNGVYIRLGSTSRPAGPEILAELQRSVLTLSYDQQALPDLTADVLDFAAASRIFSSCGKEINEGNFRSLGVLIATGNRWVPSIGGLILFGKKSERRQLLPDVEIRCARFLGETKSYILDQMDVEGTILDAVTDVPKFIARNTRLASAFGSMQRKDIPEYPPIAVREALINSLVHADYSLRGSHIQIAVFDNRLEIQNPGMLPFGFTLEDLRAGVSRIRNRVIVQVFHALQLIEKWGSGYKRIMDACKEGGYPEPKWEELGTTIRVTFYPHPLAVIPKERRFLLADELSLSGREEAILNLFQENKALPFREIHQKLIPSLSERMLRYELAGMKRKGLLNSRGKGRAIVWQKI